MGEMAERRLKLIAKRSESDFACPNVDFGLGLAKIAQSPIRGRAIRRFQ
jgi:hypothetical protein